MGKLQIISTKRRKQKKKILKALLLSIMLTTSIKSNQSVVRRWWVRRWLGKDEGNLNIVHKSFPTEDPEEFQTFLRMDEIVFAKLLDLVSPLIKKQDTKFRDSISVRDKLTITLRFLATGEAFRSLMYAFRVHESTISLLVLTVCDAISDVLQEEYLKVPDTAADWMNIAKDFEQYWNFPNVLGAMDRKHIVFNASKKYGSAFQNYKNSQSIVLLALVDAIYNFGYIDVGCNGSVSDGGVFLNSSLYKALYDDQNCLHLPENRPLPGRNKSVLYIIVAHGAFSLSDRIMKLFSFRNMTQEQRIYNYRLSRARRVVENALGILVNRFLILLTSINLHHNKVRKITKACIVLHNFLRKECPMFSGIGEEEIDNNYIFLFALHHEGENRYKNTAKSIREEFMNYVNIEGCVPWQYDLNIMY